MVRWHLKTGTPAIISRVKSKGGKQHLNGGNITTMTRSVWAVALLQVGHMTLFETVASGQAQKGVGVQVSAQKRP